MKFLKFIYSLFFVGLSTLLYSQSKESDPVREELQRYLGYEPGLYKFTSLPYDMTMGANVSGNYQDISFVILALMGFFIICFNYKNIWSRILSYLLLFACLLTSLYYGKLINSKNTLTPIHELVLDEKSQLEGLSQGVYKIYEWNYRLMQPILSKTEKLMESHDFMTIPILLLGIILIFQLSQQLRLDKKKKWIPLLLFSGISGILWLLLSAGVVWYGFICLVSLILIILCAYEYTQRKEYRIIIVGIIFAWIVLGTFFKTSSIYYLTDTPNFLLDPPVWSYYSGQGEASSVFNSYNQNLSQALDIMNRNDSDAIYKIGTSYSSFIENSSERLYEDNLLGFYHQLSLKYKPEEISEVLYSNGFRYVLLGLKVWSLDKSPEQSLKKKYQSLYTILRKDKKFSLVATDRLVKSNGKLSYTLDGEVQNYGYFALFRINE